MAPMREAHDVLPPAWHSLPWQEAARAHQTDPENGLTKEQVRRHPPAPAIEDIAAWRQAASMFTRQFKGAVILILLAAAVVFWFMGHVNDSAGIAFSVILAVVLGFVTDFRSQRALAALKSLNAPTASVLRD